MVAMIGGVDNGSFFVPLGCSHFGALLLDFYFTENILYGLLTLSLSQYLLAKVMSIPEFFDFLTGLVSSAIGLLIGVALEKKSKKSI